jgi:SAM-dependent methyltransferase
MNWGREYLAYLIFVAEIIKRLRVRSVLDIGCGDGRLLKLIGNSVTHRMGIDLCQEAITFAKAFEPEVEWQACDVATLNKQYDCVCLLEVLEHIAADEISAFLDHVVRRIKAGGFLVISVPTKVLKLQPKHYRHYDRASLLGELRLETRGLREVDVAYVYRQSALWELLRRLLCNRHWEIRTPVINTFLWKVTTSRLQVANEHNGRRLVMVLSNSSQKADKTAS